MQKKQAAQKSPVEIVHPGEFEAHRHWYQKAINARIHPMVQYFFNMSQERMIVRYCHMHPLVDPGKLRELLNYSCKHLKWAGADLLNATSLQGNRQMMLIENNSCPSGQKSMPPLNEYSDQTGYHLLIEQTFKPALKSSRSKISGYLAVLYDKNYMETSGYAYAMADVMNEPVYLVPFYNEEDQSHVRFGEGVMYIFTGEDWVPIRACFRYLTQKPWNRLPLQTKTKIVNPISACLAGGRNKLVAAKAYEIFNTEIAPYGLRINFPETIWEIRKNEIPIWLQQMGGMAVIKEPYSNAGQGVYTIVTEKDLDDFMAKDHSYDLFIIQSLIGNANWSSTTQKGKFYQVGTMPNKKNKTYVSDIRMVVASTPKGIIPISTNSRKAEAPLSDSVDKGSDSWKMLGTNLSYLEDGKWKTDTNRLILMDVKDFNQLGIGLDSLIDAYIQAVLSTIAIDQMATRLTGKNGKFKIKLFSSLNDDASLLDEIREGQES